MRVLVTGGAGFIGSHIAESYSSLGHEVGVLDNLVTGNRDNVPAGVDLSVGDISDIDTVRHAVKGAELIFHQAAARAVQRSVEDPLGTDRSNTLGTLNVLVAARDAGVRRVVLASSSSIYGGLAALPTPESAQPQPKSPYAVSKLAAEHYGRIFAELYGLETVALRYFNVFGPRQSPQSQYAAVIPLFIEALNSGRELVIHGDGEQSRDFTYIDDVVQANRLAASTGAEIVSGKAYNIGRGEQHSLLELIDCLTGVLGVTANSVHIASRSGDVRSSKADISAAINDLGFRPAVGFQDGLGRTVDWFRGRNR